MKTSMPVLVTIVLLASTGFSQDYLAKTIGSLGGGHAVATAINSSGQIVGSGKNAVKATHAFLWDPQTGMLDLGTLPGMDGSIATGVSDTGQVVGCSSFQNSNDHVFSWTSKRGMEDLGPVGFPTGSCVVAVNNVGQVVWSSTPNLHLFRWTHSGGTKDLGVSVIAYGTNDDSQIVCENIVDGLRHAAIVSPGSGFKDLGTLNAWPNSEGFAINANGDAAGVSYSYTIPPEDGFLWTAAMGMQSIGMPSQGGAVYALNDHQQIGGWVLGPNTLHPFVWSQAGGIRDLIDQLPVAVRNDPHFWAARGINNAGQIVVSENTAPKANPYLLTPKMNVALGSSANPSQVGQSVTFTASVTSVQGAPPDGEQITFKDKARTIGTAVLLNGSASLTISNLKAGTHSITATYSGDVNYHLSKSSPVIQVVNP